MDDATLHDPALADLRKHEACVQGMIDQHKSGAGFIATANDGQPAKRSDEGLERLEEMLASARADIEDMEKED